MVTLNILFTRDINKKVSFTVGKWFFLIRLQHFKFAHKTCFGEFKIYWSRKK